VREQHRWRRRRKVSIDGRLLRGDGPLRRRPDARRRRGWPIIPSSTHRLGRNKTRRGREDTPGAGRQVHDGRAAFRRAAQMCLIIDHGVHHAPDRRRRREDYARRRWRWRRYRRDGGTRQQQRCGQQRHRRIGFEDVSRSGAARVREGSPLGAQTKLRSFVWSLLQKSTSRTTVSEFFYLLPGVEEMFGTDGRQLRS